MRELNKKEEDIFEIALRILMGDYTSLVDFLKLLKDKCVTIPDMLFYRNFEKVMLGLDEKKTSAKMVGEKLAQSEYGSNVGVVLINYICSFESSEKGKCMAYLMDATSKGFITPSECIRFCRYLKDVSLGGLLYLKNNVHKKTVRGDMEDYPYILELKNNGLMYNNSGVGSSFELDAYLLDKYSLSYDDDEKYGGYSEKLKGLPGLSEFPPVPVYISGGTEPYMNGLSERDTSLKKNFLVEDGILKIGK